MAVGSTIAHSSLPLGRTLNARRAAEAYWWQALSEPRYTAILWRTLDVGLIVCTFFVLGVFAIFHQTSAAKCLII